MDEGRAFFRKRQSAFDRKQPPEGQRVNGDAANIFQKKAMGKFFSTVPTQTAGS